MTDRLSIPLREPVQAWAAITDAWQWAKPLLIAGHRLVLLLRLENRSDAQNRLLHSRLGDVVKHCEWSGARRDVDTWRRLFTSAWMRTRGDGVELLPAIDGHGVDIVYASTTKLSRAECADLSEYIMAWGSERDVPWCAASLALDWPEPVRGTRARAKAIERGDVNEETGEILETTA